MADRQTPTLTTEDILRLQAALLKAFTFEGLRRLLSDASLAELANAVPLQGRSLEAITLDLAQVAVDRQRFGELAQAAHAAAPEDPAPAALAGELAGATLDYRTPCPYPGMASFADDRRYPFYGRERETEQIVQALRLHPFLALLGASGSGKSSLLAAGALEARMLVGHTASVYTAAYSADGAAIVTASSDATTRQATTI